MTASVRSVAPLPHSTAPRQHRRPSRQGTIRTSRPVEGTSTPVSSQGNGTTAPQRMRPVGTRETFLQTGTVITHPTARGTTQNPDRQPLRERPNTPTRSRSVTSLPEKSKQIPFWLRCAIALKHGSSIVTFCLVTAVLMVYASTVGIQKEWSSAYQKRQALQDTLHDLSVARAQIDNHLGSEAGRSGLQPPSPDNTIFLEPSPIEANAAPNAVTPTPLTPTVSTKTPLGY